MNDFIQHGGGLDAAIAAYGGTRSEWLDLSTGINPHAYPMGPIADHVWKALPDRSLVEHCLDAARRHYCVPDEADIVAAPGTQSIIQWLPYLWPNSNIEIVSPTYGEYAHVFDLANRQVTERSEVDRPASPEAVIVVANPNNPDGRMWTLDACEAILSQGAKLVIDEAFIDLVPDQSLISLAARPNVLVLKSFGKFFGLAGVRLGFAVGQDDLVAKLRAMLGPWSVPGPSLAIGAQALADAPWIARTRGQVRQQRRHVQQVLLGMGCTLVGGTDLFVTVADDRAAAIAEGLARDRILVRTFDYRPSWLRFGLPGNVAEMARLSTALRRTCS